MDPKDNNTNPTPNSDSGVEAAAAPVDNTTTPAADSSATDTAPDVTQTAQPVNDAPLGAVELDKPDDVTPGIATMPESPEPQAAPSVPDMSDLGETESPGSPNITIDSTKDAPKTEKKPKTFDDLQPASPLPGSIGSATSGPATTGETSDVTPNLDATAPEPSQNIMEETDTTKPSIEDTIPASTPPKEPTISELAENTPAAVQPDPIAITPQKKDKHPSKVVLIVLIALLVAACIGVAIFVIQANSQNSKNTSNTPAATTTTTTASTSALVCAADITANQPEALQGSATKAKRTLTFSYDNKTFNEVIDVEAYTFDSSETATAKTTDLKSAYQTAYTSLGLTSDPFNSEFTTEGVVAKAKHTATLDNLNAKNASLIGLPLDSSGVVVTDQEAAQKTLESNGYVCASASTEQTTKTTN